MDIIRWSIPKSDWSYSLQPKMEKLDTVSKNKTGSWLWLRAWTSHCQIQTLIEESRENNCGIQVLPKSNPLAYTMQVTNRFKGLDLTDTVPEELWTEVRILYSRWWSKPSQEEEMQKGKMVVWGGLINSKEKKRSERQRRKGKIHHLNAEFQRIAKRDKKAFPVINEKK